MAKNPSDQPDKGAFHTLAFATRAAAEKAYEEFVRLGVSTDDISLFVHAEPPDDASRDAALDHDVNVGGAVGAPAPSHSPAGREACSPAWVCWSFPVSARCSR